MQNIIFLPDDLQTLVDTKATNIGLTTAAFITDILTEAFKDELNNLPSKSYSALYTELKDAVVEYVKKHKKGDRFTLRDIPYYADLGFTTINKTHSIPSSIRARLGRSFNEDVRFSKSPELKDIQANANGNLKSEVLNIKRAVTRSGKLAFSKADNTRAAIYEIY